VDLNQVLYRSHEPGLQLCLLIFPPASCNLPRGCSKAEILRRPDRCRYSPQRVSGLVSFPWPYRLTTRLARNDVLPVRRKVKCGGMAQGRGLKGVRPVRPLMSCTGPSQLTILTGPCAGHSHPQITFNDHSLFPSSPDYPRLSVWSSALAWSCIRPGRLPQLMLLLRFQLLPLGSRAAKTCPPDGKTYILYQMPTSILLNTTADFNNLIQLDDVDDSQLPVPPKGGHS
jgi:hypothetical protein